MLRERGPFDIIIGSDVIYLETLVQPLVNVIVKACQLSARAPIVYICVEKRNAASHDMFLEKLAARNFVFKRITKVCHSNKQKEKSKATVLRTIFFGAKKSAKKIMLAIQKKVKTNNKNRKLQFFNLCQKKFHFGVGSLYVHRVAKVSVPSLCIVFHRVFVLLIAFLPV